MLLVNTYQVIYSDKLPDGYFLRLSPPELETKLNVTDSLEQVVCSHSIVLRMSPEGKDVISVLVKLNSKHVPEFSVIAIATNVNMYSSPALISYMAPRELI